MGMSPDALPSLKAGRATRADLPSERSAAGKQDKEDAGQHNAKTRRDRAETAAEIEEEELELEQAQQLNSTPTAMTGGVAAAVTTGTDSDDLRSDHPSHARPREPYLGDRKSRTNQCILRRARGAGLLGDNE